MISDEFLYILTVVRNMLTKSVNNLWINLICQAAFVCHCSDIKFKNKLCNYLYYGSNNCKCAVDKKDGNKWKYISRVSTLSLIMWGNSHKNKIIESNYDCN